MKSKLININQISKRHQSCILAYGHFTTIHSGHIRYLKHAKRLGKTLVVALKGDDNVDGAIVDDNEADIHDDYIEQFSIYISVNQEVIRTIL